MRIAAEISIDIDANRKIWMQAYAEPVEPDKAAEVSAGLTEALTTQALAACSVVNPQIVIEGKGADIARDAGGQSLEAFGDDAD